MFKIKTWILVVMLFTLIGCASFRRWMTGAGEKAGVQWAKEKLDESRLKDKFTDENGDLSVTKMVAYTTERIKDYDEARKKGEEKGFITGEIKDVGSYLGYMFLLAVLGKRGKDKIKKIKEAKANVS